MERGLVGRNSHMQSTMGGKSLGGHKGQMDRVLQMMYVTSLCWGSSSLCNPWFKGWTHSSSWSWITGNAFFWALSNKWLVSPLASVIKHQCKKRRENGFVAGSFQKMQVFYFRVWQAIIMFHLHKVYVKKKKWPGTRVTISFYSKMPYFISPLNPPSISVPFWVAMLI